MYEVFVLKANANPRRSLVKPIKAFLASSAANNGVSADASIVPMLSKEAEKHSFITEIVKGIQKNLLVAT